MLLMWRDTAAVGFPVTSAPTLDATLSLCSADKAAFLLRYNISVAMNQVI